MLVVGEPQVDALMYGQLPGAKAEAQAVAKALAGPGALGTERVVQLTDGNNATSIINALFERRYRIVHVAGHGEPVQRDDKGEITSMGGVVLSDGTFLGPNEIRAMRTVPELVFVNCCHLAHRDTAGVLRHNKAFNRAEFAWGVADSLIEIGVRCVIAAGWAVDDGPAKVFAETFYREILARRPFITAVATAREAAWNEDKSSNTWAAYQAYGDPNWVYRRSAGEAAAVALPPREEFEGVSSPLGLALALEEQAVRSKWMRADCGLQLEKVRHLEARFAAQWGGMGAVAEAFAVAYSEAGDRDNGISWYERALQAADGSAALRAHEQLGNLLARRGWDQAREARAKAEASGQTLAAPALQAPRQDILRALQGLEQLTALQSTAERLSLCGSACKRLAMLETLAGNQTQALEAVDRALVYYRRAEEQAGASNDAKLHYPALNRMALEFVRHAGSPTWLGFEAEHSASVRRSLQRASATEPGFENQVGLIEIDMFEALAAQKLSGMQSDLTAALNNLRVKAPGLRGWQSVADQADLVLGSYMTRAGEREKVAAAGLLALLTELAKQPVG